MLLFATGQHVVAKEGMYVLLLMISGPCRNGLINSFFIENLFKIIHNS